MTHKNVQESIAQKPIVGLSKTVESEFGANATHWIIVGFSKTETIDIVSREDKVSVEVLVAGYVNKSALDKKRIPICAWRGVVPGVSNDTLPTDAYKIMLTSEHWKDAKPIH